MTFDIWVEGHTEPDGRQIRAYKLGTFDGATFAAACQTWYALTNRPAQLQVNADGTVVYNGSQFFDNQTDAQKRNG